MQPKLSAKVQVTVQASPARVWAAITTPALVKQYMMGADVKNDWRAGSSLVYTGEYHGKRYEEKGVIQKIEPERMLQATHFSSTSGKADKPENYALVTWEIHPKGGASEVCVSQEGIENQQAVEGSKANWKSVLEGLKKTAEALPAASA